MATSGKQRKLHKPLAQNQPVGIKMPAILKESERKDTYCACVSLLRWRLPNCNGSQKPVVCIQYYIKEGGKTKGEHGEFSNFLYMYI